MWPQTTTDIIPPVEPPPSTLSVFQIDDYWKDYWSDTYWNLGVELNISCEHRTHAHTHWASFFLGGADEVTPFIWRILIDRTVTSLWHHRPACELICFCGLPAPGRSPGFKQTIDPGSKISTHWTLTPTCTHCSDRPSGQHSRVSVGRSRAAPISTEQKTNQQQHFSVSRLFIILISSSVALLFNWSLRIHIPWELIDNWIN